MLGGTFFYDTEEGNRIGSLEEVLPITLYKGMIMTIHSYMQENGALKKYEVVSWNYHLGHEDEEAGLRIELKSS